MSCPGRRVRSQSPDTFPADTGPINPPARDGQGSSAQHPAEASQVAAPGRWCEGGSSASLAPHTVSSWLWGELWLPHPACLPPAAAIPWHGGNQGRSWGHSRAW